MLVLLCIFLLVVSSSALDVFQIPVYSFSTHTDVIRPNRLHVQHNSSLQSFYTIHIGMGTPSQVLPVLLDTLSADLWVYDISCQSESCKQRTKKFEPIESQSYVKKNEDTQTCHNPYAGAFSANIITDNVQFGGTTLIDQDCLSIVEVTSEGRPGPFSGAVGLAWPAVAHKETSPVAISIFKQVPRAVLTIWYDSKYSGNQLQESGAVTFGTYDVQHCEDQMSTVPVFRTPSQPPTYWKFSIPSLAVGSAMHEIPTDVFLDTASSRIGLPKELYQSVMWQLDATKEPSLDGYAVPCHKEAQLPNLVLDINEELQLEISPKQYISPITKRREMCALVFYQSETNDLYLGGPFFQSYCVLLDYDKGQISFAKHKESGIY